MADWSPKNKKNCTRKETWSFLKTFETQLGFLMFLFTCGYFIKESKHSHKCTDTWLVVERLLFRIEVKR